MTDILPPAGWPNVRQLETNEFATGGANGNMNEQAKSLAARSELLKKYAALPYESKTGGYALNERVQLANGDIVRSTIPNNKNDPNVNMTGWVIPYPPTTPNATETVAGKAAIATQSETIAGTNDATIITPKKLKDISFGRTGGYANVIASRSANTVYTNPKNTPLVVAITAGAQASTALNNTSIISGGLEAVYASIGSGSMISTQIVIVPPLAQYRLNNPLSIVKWMEW